MNFTLMVEHNFSLEELDNMLPWEREIYTSLLINKIREQNEQRKKQ